MNCVIIAESVIVVSTFFIELALVSHCLAKNDISDGSEMVR